MGAEMFFCPMIKANGYGHGDVQLAKCLESDGVQFMGVALIEEAIGLREKGILANILFFGGFSENSVKEIIHHRLTPVISTWPQLKSFVALAPKNYPVHIKFDTGMNRMGFDLDDVDLIVEHLKKSQLKVEGVCTHLHSGEDADNMNGESFKQLRLFKTVEDKFKSFGCYSHALNSSGLLNFVHLRGQNLPHEISHMQGARPGISIYGVTAFDRPSVELKPVMSLRTKITKYKKLKMNSGVSYGITWKAHQESTIAVLPVGYADGYRRSLSNKGKVLFRGQFVPVIGTVCMDYIMIDVTAVVGNESIDRLASEEVTLWGMDSSGNYLSARDVAKEAGTISYEMFTGVSSRVPRIYLEGPSQ